jgi:hypothetical protein
VDKSQVYSESWQTNLIEERVSLKSTTDNPLAIKSSILDLPQEVRCMIFNHVYTRQPLQVALVLNAKGKVEEIVDTRPLDDHFSVILVCHTFKQEAIPILRLYIPRWIKIGISEFPQSESRHLGSRLQQAQGLRNFHNIKMVLTEDLSHISLHSLTSFAELFMIKTVLRAATAPIAISTEFEHCDDVIQLFETLRNLGKSIALSSKSGTSTARRAVYSAIMEVSGMSDSGLIASIRETWTARCKASLSMESLVKAESKM